MQKCIFSVLVFFSFCATAQVKITESDSGLHSVSNLVRYFTGRGIKISNLRYTGDKRALGRFSDANSTLGLSGGIALSTGLVKAIEGPNDSSNTSSEFNRPGDPTLESLKPALNNLNAAVIEFDFVPLTDTIKFSLVFGSDEYNSKIEEDSTKAPIAQDLFAAFLSGPGYGINSNIATIDGIGDRDFISVHNINNGNADFDEILDGPCVNCQYFINNPYTDQRIAFNGYTEVIEVKAPVNQCATYSLKLAIADATTISSHDSGVLLQKGHFGERKILSTIQPVDDSDTLFLCKGEPLPVFSITTTSGNKFTWFVNDSLSTLSGTNIIPQTTGEYKVVVTLSGGCTWSDSINVKIGENFPLQLQTLPNIICKNQLLTVAGIVPATVTGARVKWHTQPEVAMQDSLWQAISITGTTSFLLKVKNEGGCLRTATGVVTVNPVFFEINPHPKDTSICLGSSINFIGNLTKNNSLSDPVNFYWYSPSRQVLATTDGFSFAPRDTAIYTFVYKSQNGCTDSAKLNVNVEKIPLQHTPDSEICIGSAMVLTASGAAGYVWKRQGNLNTLSGLSSLAISPTLTGFYTIKGLSSSSLKCETANDTIDITVNSLPNISKTKDTTVCRGTSLEIKIKNAFKVTWADTLLKDSVFTHVAIQKSALSFTGFSSKLCSVKGVVNIGLHPLINVSIAGRPEMCRVDTASLTARGGSSYVWLNNLSTQSKINFRPLANETFTVVGQSLQICKDTAYFTTSIKSFEPPVPDFLLSKRNGKLCPERKIIDTLSAPDGYKYLWRYGNSQSFTTQTLEALFTGRYTLAITESITGCSLSDTLVAINECPTDTVVPPPPVPEPEFAIPNYFSPNGDGINDYFEIMKMGSNTKVTIHNRWGTVVYRTENYDNRWDASAMPDGLYFYNIETNRNRYSGWVQILR